MLRHGDTVRWCRVARMSLSPSPHSVPLLQLCWSFIPHPSAKRCWGSVLLMLLSVTKPVLGPPRCCFRENLVPFWKILQSCLSVIALSSWEEKRWNEKAGAGRKYRVCIGRAQGALLVYAAPGNPWSLLTVRIILWKAMALLAGVAGGTSTSGGFAGSRAAPRRCLPWEETHFWKDPGWIWSPNPPRLALGAGSTKRNRVCGRTGGLAQTFFNKYKSYARASQMSCIRISHLPCPFVVCRKPEWWELFEGKGRGFSLQETNFSVYPSSAFTFKCFLCASGQRTRVAPTLVREQGWSCSLIHFP